ncbi:rhomboid family intramembrane serine protease [Streptococcus sp. zg-JUN1979]|uniref:rhomboid family intramembrane serine protease n=1 Tax=Streptococcus sp. zg-JUN1979 TaxID=3391450 RepID=UPI0039A51F37
MKALFRDYPVTMGLLGLTTLIFLMMQVLYPTSSHSGLVGLQFGAMYGDLIKVYPAQIWRLVSAIFVHFGWEHFLLNALTLYFLGQMAESIWGSARFLLLYMLSGIMGNVITLVFTPNVIAAGASTAIFGLFAAIIVLAYYGQNPYLKQLGRSYQLLIGLNLLMNLVTPGVSLAGHLGGLLGGGLIAVYLPSLAEGALFEKKIRLMALVAYIVIGLGLLLLALV